MRIIIMSLKCFVKVGSINNLSDARYCSGMNVDLLGFILEENNIDSIDICTLKEISNWIAGIKILGEFNNSSIKFINNIIKKFPFDYIQINYPIRINKINYDHQRILLNLPLEERVEKKKFISDLRNNYKDIGMININVLNKTTNNLISNNFKNNRFKLLNGFNYSKKFLDKMINKRVLYGVSINGNNEIRPGYKDYSTLSEVFEILEKN